MKKLIAIICVISFMSIIACSTFRSDLWLPATQEQAAEFVGQVRQVPGNPESHYLLGCYYQEQGMYYEALQEFKKTLTIDPAHINAYNGMGISYDHVKNFDAAAAAYEAALKLNPRLGFVYNNLGYSSFLQGDYNKAVSALEKAVALSNGNARIQNNLGLAYAKMNDFKKAMQAFEAAGDETQARNNLAKVQRGDAEEASAVMTAKSPAEEEASAGLTAKSSAETAPPLSARNDSIPEPKKEMHEQRRDLDGGIEISNGNGINNMARNVGCYLKKKGFRVVRYTNADHFGYKSAVICYREGFRENALQLRRQLPKAVRLEVVDELERANVKVKVLLGRDFIRYGKSFQEVKITHEAVTK